MTETTKKSGNWIAVRQQLTTWEKPALLALVKDLYDTSTANGDFIRARCRVGKDGGGAAVEAYRKKIDKLFFPRGDVVRPKLGEARKAIREYRKATGDANGTAELMLTYVECGTRFTREYGDIDEGFYDSVESVLEELAGLLRGEALGLYPQLRDRLAGVELMACSIGWGFSDSVSDIICHLETDLAAD